MESKSIIFIAVLSALVGSIAGYAGGQLGQLSDRDQVEPAKIDNSMTQRLAQMEREFSRIKSLNRLPAQVPSDMEDASESAPTSNDPNLDDESEEEMESVSDLVALHEQQVFDQATTVREIKQTMLLENGFTQEEADWVLQSEAEADLDSLYDTYSYRKRSYEEAKAKGLVRKTDQERLREKLGDDYYERYLEANGLTSKPLVAQVIKGSPGDNSGLQQGDRILSYDGERVFNFRDVTNLTLQGNEGESVLIEVERDGNPVQITIPRGPIGVVSGRGR